MADAANLIFPSVTAGHRCAADNRTDAGAADLGAMVPRWARDTVPDMAAPMIESMSEVPSQMNGHHPTLPLPPAGISAAALLAVAITVKAGLHVLRQTLRGRDFR